MLNDFKAGMIAWKVDVVEQGDELVFAPAKAEIVDRERGMIRYKNPSGGEWLWYGSQFFNSRTEALIECQLLELEAEGVLTERKKAEKAEYNHLKEPGKLWRIF